MIQQPKPESKKYSDLISEIQKGEIKIPKFQREFVRSLEQTAKLLDSIIKGYPIGTFIMRKTNERLNDIKNIGNLSLPAVPDDIKVQYVLDGQQRMTSLYAAYCWAKIQKKWEKKITDYSKIYVNLDIDENSDEQIITAEISENIRHISLYDLLNMKHSELNSNYSSDEIDKIYNLKELFTTYEFSTIILRKEDIDSAIEVFTRINTGWQTLTLFEIMSAKTYDEELKFDMSENFQKIIKELADIKYDTISSSIILNILSLILSKNKECKRKTILQLDKQDIINIREDVISSLKESIDYFRSVYRIPVSSLLPYDSLLVPFAYFFYFQKDKPKWNQIHLLEEFFWRMSLSYRYSSSTESKLSQDIKRIDEIIQWNKPNYDDIKVQLDSPQALIDTNFSAWSSFCKAILCLLAYHEPKDFNHNGKVLLDNSWLKVANSRNYHHFFPRSYLKKTWQKNENSIVNITLVSADLNKRKIKAKAPSIYISDFLEENNELGNSLKSHLIFNYKEYWILSDDYDIFLSKRAKSIYNELYERINGKHNIESFENDFKTKILNWENEKTEFKETLRRDIRQWMINSKMEFSVAKTICAFMNTDGGTLLIWVSDDWSIPWLNRDYNTFPDWKKNKDGFELHLKWVIKKYLWDNLEKYIHKISFPIIDEVEICMIEIFKNSNPIFVKFEWKEEYYIRNGNWSEPKSGSWLVWYL